MLIILLIMKLGIVSHSSFNFNGTLMEDDIFPSRMWFCFQVCQICIKFYLIWMKFAFWILKYFAFN